MLSEYIDLYDESFSYSVEWLESFGSVVSETLLALAIEVCSLESGAYVY